MRTWQSQLCLGLDYEKTGVLSEAEGAIEEAVRLAPRVARPREELARILANRGAVSQALRELRRTLVMDDRSVNTYLTLSRILEGKGLLPEAAKCLNDGVLLRTGPMEEVHVSLGRLHSRMGLLKEAEKDFVRAIDLCSSWAKPYVGLAGVLKRRGNLGGAEKALRQALLAEPTCGEARLTLLDLLLERGNKTEARRVAREMLASCRDIPPAQVVECLCKLVERGVYGELEGAVRRYLLDLDEYCAGWYGIFSALLCAHRYQEAFRLGEAILERFICEAQPSEFSALMWPWFRRARRQVGEWKFCQEQLRLIRLTRQEARFSHWFAYCRAVLMLTAAGEKHDEILDECRVIRRRPAARYFWMRQPFIFTRLISGDFDGAISDCETILAQRPDLWWARCRLAEACLAKGDVQRARKELMRAENTDDLVSKREVLTWHGEILLWLGEYGEALRKMDEAIRLGATTFVYGWRGAAYLRQGHYEKALADLNRAVELDPKDLEAFVWRGEALRLLGRCREALEDLDFAIERKDGYSWALFNRALVWDALADESSMRADFRMLPSRIIAFLRKKIGIRKSRHLLRGEMREILLAGLDLSKGVRRNEDYPNLFWMR